MNTLQVAHLGISTVISKVLKTPKKHVVTLQILTATASKTSSVATQNIMKWVARKITSFLLLLNVKIR